MKVRCGGTISNLYIHFVRGRKRRKLIETFNFRTAASLLKSITFLARGKTAVSFIARCKAEKILVNRGRIWSWLEQFIRIVVIVPKREELWKISERVRPTKRYDFSCSTGECDNFNAFLFRFATITLNFIVPKIWLASLPVKLTSRKSLAH